LASNRIASLYLDDLERLWVGTTKGLQLKVSETDFIEPLQTVGPDLRINHETIMDIKQDVKGDVWIASNTALTYISKDLETAQEYVRGEKSGFSSNQWVRSVMPLGERKVLVGTDLGLYLWDRNNQKAELLLDDFIIKIHQDSNQRVRVLTRSNLYHYNSYEKRLNVNEMPSYINSKGAVEGEYLVNECNGITEDLIKQLWVICNNRLLVFGIDSNAVKQVFNLAEQLDLSNFLTGEHSFTTLNDGQIALGMRSGAYTFLPKEVEPNLRIISPKLTRVNARFSDKQSNNIQLLNNYKQMSAGKIHNLTSNLHRINLHFSHLSLLPLSDFDFEYRLTGYESDWLPIKPKQYSVEYNGLPFGNYRFELRARYKTSQWQQTQFAFEIAKPIWLSYWAYFTYVALFVTLIWSTVKWRTRKLQLQSHKLSQLVQDKTAHLESSKKEIERLLKSKEQLVEQIYHQTKTPLQLLVGHLNQFERNEITNEEVVTKQKRVIIELSQLTEQALKVAKHEYVPSKNIQCFDVAKTLHSTILCLQESAEQKDLELRVSVDETAKATMDPQDLRLIVQNLIENAIKYTEQGAVSFSAKQLNRELIITCKDTGIGIPQGERSSILRRYKRASNGLHIQGDGIGLSVIDLIVRSLQGSIDIRNNRSSELTSNSGGSVFTVRLPVCLSEDGIGRNSVEPIRDFIEHLPESESESESELSITSNKNSGVRQKTILIVEDNIELSAYLKSIFKRQYKILSCLSVTSGFNKALSQVPDLIISDIMLNDVMLSKKEDEDYLSGFNLIEQIRHDRVTDHIPIIMVTAKSDQDSRDRAMQLGANDYITKPFDESVLLERVKNLLCLFDRVGQKSQLSGSAKVEHSKDRVIASFIDLVTREFSNAELTVSQISEKLHVSNRQLERKCRVLLNATPKEFLNNFRLINAQRLIKKGASVKQTIEACGFSSASYFSRKYKQTFNISPSDDSKKTADKAVL
ncbi:MAG: response regulator, partial [Kangiellaceae bacterium]|nr:response regulator [Kangiellaceae bacterium]